MSEFLTVEIVRKDTPLYLDKLTFQRDTRAPCLSAELDRLLLLLDSSKAVQSNKLYTQPDLTVNGKAVYYPATEVLVPILYAMDAKARMESGK